MSDPAFSHRDRGTRPEEWSVTRELDPVTLADCIPPEGALVVVAAHPDDEALGAGGLIATAVEWGHNVTVILCSDGEASHPGSPTHTSQRLASIRRNEFLAALEALRGNDRAGAGTITPVMLGLPDGDLSSHLAAMKAAIREYATAPCSIAVPLREDGHPDHEAAGIAAARVAADRVVTLLEYPIWYWHWATPGSDRLWSTMHPLHLTEDARRAKQRALASYPSQTEPLSTDEADAAVLHADFLGHFSHDIEMFRLSAPGRGSAENARSTFNTLFQSDPDPWNFGNEYESRKREILLASLPRDHYKAALELGSATGALTERLASRCDRVIAIDASDTAIERAKARLASFANIRLERRDIPREWSEISGVDLVIVSEIGYFLTESELHGTFEAIECAITRDAHILLCHWLHPIDGWSLTGRDVHRAAHDRSWRPLVTHREADFLLEVFAVTMPSYRQRVS